MQFKENIIAWGLFGGILLSTRFVFYHFLQHYWFGAVGIISVVVFTLFYLARKNKLGFLGKILIKKIFSKVRGKTFKLFLVQSIFAIYILALFTGGITVADQKQVKVLTTELKKNNITDTSSLLNHDLSHSIDPNQIPIMILVMLVPNHVLFSTVATLNVITDGWFLSISTIGLVEEIEFLGIILYFRHKKIGEVLTP